MLGTDARLLELRDRLSGQVLRGTGGVQYFLRDLIGEGGQGWVFRANWDEPDGFGVIVKVLRPDAVSSDALARFHFRQKLGEPRLRFIDRNSNHRSNMATYGHWFKPKSRAARVFPEAGPRFAAVIQALTRG